ncbi:MAG: DUF4838 domain-containing protein, partial [Planctomycetes bacterium]|nr:DUF4838 domain-containing protein [Planctomycetota bacterium]
QPKARTYVVSPNDGYGWCECGRCKAFDLVYAEGRKAEGGYPVTTDRVVRFVNEVTATVNRAYPDLLTQTLAYVNYVEPPSTFRPLKNSIIWHCHYTPACYAHAIANPDCPENAKFKAHLERWLKVAPESLGIYAYTDKSMWFYLPRPVAQPMAADIKLFHRLGIKYYYAQSAGAVWAQNLPLYYLTAKLLWNVNEDVDAVVGDFYRCLFDDAARPMREFYAAFEKAAAKTGVHFNHSARTEAPQFLTPEVMADARAKLDEAAGLAKPDPVAQRIAAVREHFERSYGLWDMIYNYYVYEETGKREYLQKAAALLPKQLKARGVDTWFAGQFRGIEQEAGALGGLKWSGFGKEMTLGGRQCWNSDETGPGDNAAGWASFEFFLDDVTKPIRIRMLVWGKSEFSSLVICSEGRGKGLAAGGKWTPLKPDKPLSGQEQWDEMVFAVAPDKFEKGRQRQIVGFGGGDSQVWVAEATVEAAK